MIATLSTIAGTLVGIAVGFHVANSLSAGRAGPLLAGIIGVCAAIAAGTGVAWVIRGLP